MKKYVIGVDGGGTKTAFALAEEDRTVLSTAQLPSISYREHGMEAVASRLTEGAAHVLNQAGVEMSQVGMIAIGAPGFGESAAGDMDLLETVKAAFPKIPTVLVNDAEIAYYGSLSGHPGVNVVAGTGAIAYGGDGSGKTARSGGWSEKFSDEGSCYWLGKMAMGLFCKEADGRESKGPLYHILRKEFQLENDFDFIEVVERDYLPVRSEVAGFQRYLLMAAREGDQAALGLYHQACEELVQQACAIKNRLNLQGVVSVSLTGGLLYAGEIVTGPLSKMLAEKGMEYRPCAGSPLDGAVYLACRQLERLV